VRGLQRLSALDVKLLRDLWGMKGQATAIALVVAAGVAMFVTYQSNFDSLRRTLETYYDADRFADVFASVKRAPRRLEQTIAALPGVSTVETRVVADVTLDVGGFPEPVTGRLISVPADRRPSLNDVVLMQGRWIEPGRPDEVVASEPFAQAHGLGLGDRVAALVNGRRRELRIVGLGLSPEYVYTIAPGEVIPDDRRFGIVWMERGALASAFDLEGGFNDVVLRLAPGASADEVVDRLDRLLAPYGGLKVIPRRLQPSHWTLDNELAQLQTFGLLVPSIFLGIAAFLLNVSLARVLALQRPQIAALKALGYGNGAIGWHYLKWALLIAAGGAALGVGAGAWLGSVMIGLYNHYFRFPVLLYRLSTGIAAQAAAVALAAAALGAVFAVRRAVALPPAEAMRAEPPGRYRRSIAEWPSLQRRLGHTARMVLRNLERRPWRAAATTLGLALAMGILMFGFVFVDVMALLAELEFDLAERQDLTVNFVEPVSARALHELRALPGVLQAQPLRVVPARISHGHLSRYLALSGSPSAPELRRTVALDGRVVTLPAQGLVLSEKLGEILGVRAGDIVEVEVLEGQRPVVRLAVAGLVDDSLGLVARMEIGALHRLLQEGDSLSGAYLAVDSARRDVLYRRLKTLPRVGHVAVTAATLESFRRVMGENFRVATTFNLSFAAIIAFGVVYNAARISLSERSRELASLRVLGFTIAEVSMILLGELALLTLLALPLGLAIGWGLVEVVMSVFRNEVYRFPQVVSSRNVAWAALGMIAAVVVSALVVRRKVDRLDLVAVLKDRES
jgi:putative ABC transport system permease protein